ncbi:MAG: quinate 5-dehydrogenase [Armatimonadetes bacterium]|nr:quinate 5-dehydrogenase [Armatimonadota bacterium]
MRPDGALHVVSVSIGSSSRDKIVETDLGGRHLVIERRGTDGDLERARQLIAELDGTVDAFGLGGTDLYLVAAGRRYTIRDAARIASAAKLTPVLDGSGLKGTLEPAAVAHLERSGQLDLAHSKVLVVTAVDRFGMAEALAEHAQQIVIGDLMFNLGLPIAIRGMATLQLVAKAVLPLIVRLPFKMLYPTGEKQTAITPKWGKWYAWADVIAGDFHMIRRFLPAEPDALAGKVVLTNTTTSDDVELLRSRGLSRLITTTPVFDGRSFGTNVMEAVLTALAGQREPLSPDQMLAQLEAWGWEPTVTRLDSTA